MSVTSTRRRRAQSGKSRALRVVDLFAGAGGLSEGFRQAGYEIVAGSDYDPDAAATYASNFRGAEVIVGDVRDEAVRDQIHDVAQGADVLIGGPPCQAFSQVRNHTRLIDDPRNSLYREFVNTVAETLPPAFLMENVPGMAQMGVQEQVARDLALDGEYLVTPQLVDAADFGVPQTRKRLLFLGVKRSLGTPPPTLTGTGATGIVQLVRVALAGGGFEYVVNARLGDSHAVANMLADPDDLTAVSVEQAISDLRDLEMGRRDDLLTEGLPPAASAYQRMMRTAQNGALSNVSVPRARQDTVMRLAGIPVGGNHRDLPAELQGRYLTGAKWGPHNGTGSLSRRHFYAYRRLHPDMWAWTLNTKGDSVYHYAAHRCLAVREFARLQSFPDQFTFVTDPRRGPLQGRMDGGATHSRYRQVGNAVPPLLAAAAAREISSLLQPRRNARTA